MTDKQIIKKFIRVAYEKNYQNDWFDMEKFLLDFLKYLKEEGKKQNE